MVVVKGVGSITATQRYSYTVDQTPYLNYIFPSVSYGGNGTRLYWNGHHRITDLGSDKLMGNLFIIMKGQFMECILEIVFAPGLGFIRIPLRQEMPRLYSVSSRHCRRRASIMFLSICIREGLQVFS